MDLPVRNIRAAILFLTIALAASAQTKTDSKPSTEEQAAKLFLRAIALEDQGDLPGAIRVYKQVLKLDPDDIHTINSIAGVYGKLNHPDLERTWAQKAIAIDSSFAPAYINYGNASAALGDLSEARKSFLKAMELDPKNCMGFYSLGVLEEQEHHPDKALVLYRRSVEINPKFENGYFNMAAMYANARRWDEAEEALHKVLELNPEAEDARQMLAQVEEDRKGAQ